MVIDPCFGFRRMAVEPRERQRSAGVCASYGHVLSMHLYTQSRNPPYPCFGFRRMAVQPMERQRSAGEVFAFMQCLIFEWNCSARTDRRRKGKEWLFKRQRWWKFPVLAAIELKRKGLVVYHFLMKSTREGWKLKQTMVDCNFSW